MKTRDTLWYSKTMELYQARHIADKLTRVVGDSTSRVEIAGSVRRRKANVKDIEVVAIIHDYARFYNTLAEHGRFIKPGVPDIIDWPPKHGAKYVRMLLNEGIKLDLFIANRDNWGGIYTMRTGSGVGPDGSAYNGFVPRLFSRWKRVSKGGKMSGGQPTLPNGTMLSVPEEEDYFALCHAVWIPPEERIDGNAVKSNREKTCR